LPPKQHHFTVCIDPAQVAALGSLFIHVKDIRSFGLVCMF
jgi:hypothetical protein